MFGEQRPKVFYTYLAQMQSWSNIFQLQVVGAAEANSINVKG